jgi:hypothetical protein
LKCWQRASTAVSALFVCAVSVAQHTEPTRAVESAKRILSSEEFSGRPEQSFFEKLILDFIEWLDKQFSGAPALGGLGSIIAPILIALLIACLVILASWIVGVLAGRTKDSAFSGNLASERLAPPDELLRLSEEAEIAGDYSRAFTLAFWAFLKLSDVAGLLDYSDDATNWEILSSSKFSRDTDVVARRYANLFDTIEYGDASASRDDVQAIRLLIDQNVASRTAA